MPKRGKKGQKGSKRSKGKGGDSQNQHNHNNNNDNRGVSNSNRGAFQTDSNQQIAKSLGSQDIAKMIQDKIKAMESSQNRAQNAKLLSSKDEILKTLSKIKQDFNDSLTTNNGPVPANGNTAANDADADGTAANDTKVDETKANNDNNNNNGDQAFVKHFNSLVCVLYFVV